MTMMSKHRGEMYQRLFRTVDVPRDLDAVTDIDGDREIDPALADLDPASVATIWSACQDLYRSGVHPLLSICLRRRGHVVLNRSLGHAGEGRIATVRTPVCLFSASKAVSAVLVHLLEEQGHVNLSNPVSYYIPAFAARGKGSITILQLLTHRGGIALVPEDVDLDLLFDHDAGLEMICEAEPSDHQGREQAYHALTTGFIFNELIKQTTGLNAQQYLRRHIGKPMGMRYFRYGLTKKDRGGVAINRTTGLDINPINRVLGRVLGAHPDTAVELTNDPRFYSRVIPSANLFATAEEISRFYQMLLNNGEWQGTQILDPLTVHRATRSQGKFVLDRSLMLPMRYSAGFMLGGSPIGIYGRDTQYAYGHLGYANIFCWADPQRDIAVSLMNTGKLVLGPHIKALPVLLDAISSECEPCVDMESDVPAYRRGRQQDEYERG
jgi:CubicO group peptidase (beta-lactamase class C family)